MTNVLRGKNMNDYQRVLLDIAKEFIKVCEKLNLSYFAIGGTCLGAIRHNGFIPWDDDIDFGMPREDYEKFEKEGQKYLPSHLFMQTFLTDKNYFYPFMKIRNSNTTAIESELKNKKINHGIWVDVFPMDGLPSDMNKKRKIERFDRQILRRRYLNIGYRKSFADFVEQVISFVLYPLKKCALKKSISLSKKYSFYQSDYFWWNWGSRLWHNFETKNFYEFDIVKFETISVRVPKNYDAYLTQQYGDWKKLPPIEKRNSGHSFELIDLSTPYSKYTNS